MSRVRGERSKTVVRIRKAAILCKKRAGASFLSARQVHSSTGAYIYHGKQEGTWSSGHYFGSRRRSTLDVT